MKVFTVHVLLFLFTILVSTLVVTATVSDDWRFIIKKSLIYISYFTAATVVCSVLVYFIS
ncbi:MAG: hypothetical protein QGH40_01605 [bacterium]|nr:hypothetical protein [bacterium]